VYTTIKEKDRYPLFILPKGDDLHKFNSDDYHNLMHYILNTYIMHYYKRLHSVHRDRVSFLIDRSGHSWNEVHKFLEGISHFEKFIYKIILISPGRFYSLLSPFGLPQIWNGRLEYFSTFEQAHSKFPKLLDVKLIPREIGGHLVFNLFEYSQREVQITEIYLNYIKFSENFKQFKEESSNVVLHSNDPVQATALEKIDEKCEHLLKTIQVDLNEITSKIVSWAPLESDSPENNLICNEQNLQLSYIAARYERVRARVIKIKTPLEAALKNMKSNDQTLERNAQEIDFASKIEAIANTITQRMQAIPSLSQNLDISTLPVLLKQISEDNDKCIVLDQQLKSLENLTPISHRQQLENCQNLIKELDLSVKTLSNSLKTALICLSVELNDISINEIKNREEVISSIKNFILISSISSIDNAFKNILLEVQQKIEQAPEIPPLVD